MKDFFVEAVAHEVSRRRPPTAPGHRIRLPLVRSQQPGSLKLTNADLADMLATEDIEALFGR